MSRTVDDRPRVVAFNYDFNASYQWLDRAPKGRNETGPWFRRRDGYDTGEKHLRQPLVPECVDRDRYLLMDLRGNERRR